MQIRLSEIVKITVCIVSLILLIYSIHILIDMKSRATEEVIHCSSVFDSQVNNSHLHATVTLYLYQKKGNVQISGEYTSPTGVPTLVKSVSGFVYQAVDEDYHVRFTGNRIAFRGEDINDEFNYQVPFSITSKDVAYVYKFRQENDGSYLIRQNGIPLLLCKKIA